MEIKHLEHENPQNFLLTQNVQRRKPPLNSESETIRGGFLIRGAFLSGIGLISEGDIRVYYNIIAKL